MLLVLVGLQLELLTLARRRRLPARPLPHTQPLALGCILGCLAQEKVLPGLDWKTGLGLLRWQGRSMWLRQGPL